MSWKRKDKRNFFNFLLVFGIVFFIGALAGYTKDLFSGFINLKFFNPLIGSPTYLLILSLLFLFGAYGIYGGDKPAANPEETEGSKRKKKGKKNRAVAGNG